jgi:hypothetical protein
MNVTLSLVAVPHSSWRGAQTRRGYKRRRRHALSLGFVPTFVVAQLWRLFAN